MDVLEKSKGKLTVNEQRAKLDKKPVEGGDTVYLQEQDHSLAWLAKRDAMPIDADATDQPVEEDDPEPDEDTVRAIVGDEVRQWRRSEEHKSELQSLMRISYAVFCLKKKKRS